MSDTSVYTWEEWRTKTGQYEPRNRDEYLTAEKRTWEAAIQHASQPMKCGHPQVCWIPDGGDCTNHTCSWCVSDVVVSEKVEKMFSLELCKVTGLGSDVSVREHVDHYIDVFNQAKEWESDNTTLRASLASKDAELERYRVNYRTLATENMEMRQQLEGLRKSCEAARIHCEELRSAWKRGAINESDGQGGRRSNRNSDILLSLSRALAGIPAKAAQPEPTKDMVHGVTCPKSRHAGLMGYLNSEEDDRPYDVDGINYCGRCHVALPAAPVPDKEDQ